MAGIGAMTGLQIIALQICRMQCIIIHEKLRAAGMYLIR